MPDPDDDEDGEPDRVGPKIIAGLATAAAAVRLGPAAALAFGAASPLFESLAERTWQEFRPDARQRAARVLDIAAEETGCDAEKLDLLIGKSPASRLQATLAMDAAQRTAWPPKVYALGKILAEGLTAADEDQVDLQQQALAAMADLERLHIVLLELLVRYEPDVPRGNMAALHTVPSYVSMHAGSRPGDPKVWSIGWRKWTARQVCIARPQLSSVLPLLFGTLRRHGLATENDDSAKALEQLGKDLVLQVNRRAQQNKPVIFQETTIRSAEPNWSPTELGETILGYYQLAGEEQAAVTGPQAARA